jgi:hypothetical protein
MREKRLLTTKQPGQFTFHPKDGVGGVAGGGVGFDCRTAALLPSLPPVRGGM